jgi:hypothetical protein
LSGPSDAAARVSPDRHKGRHLPAREVHNRMAEAYCVKCKTKRQVQNAQNITMKNGKPALKGTCPVCGTSLFKIGG